MKREKSDSGTPDLFRSLALVALVVGFVGSEILMFRAAGRSQPFLTVAFFIWIMLPFAALAWANMVSKSWLTLTRVALYFTTLVIALGCLAFYGGVILPPAGSGHAFPFVAGPLASWALMVIVIPIAALVSRKQ